jgi:nitrile hydratase
MTLPSGTTVRVRDDWPEARGPVHVRTPHYVRGRNGIVVRHLGDFDNPEDLAFGRPAARLPLYHVLFAQAELWLEAAGTSGDVLVELFEPWLEVQ